MTLQQPIQSWVINPLALAVYVTNNVALVEVALAHGAKVDESESSYQLLLKFGRLDSI